MTADIPMGEHGWLTVADLERPDRDPLCVVAVDDVQGEYDRLSRGTQQRTSSR